MIRKSTIIAIAGVFPLAGISLADVSTNHNGNGGTNPGPSVDVDFGEVHNTHVFPVVGSLPISGTNFTKTFNLNEFGEHHLEYSYEYVEPAFNVVNNFPSVLGGFPQVLEPNDIDLTFGEPGVGLAGMGVRETIFNNSGQLWAGYTFRLRSADFYVKCTTNGGTSCEAGANDIINLLTAQENDALTVSDIGLTGPLSDASISVTRDEDLEETIVTLDFGTDPLEFNESFDVGFLLNLSGFNNAGPNPGAFDLWQQPIPIPVPGAMALAAIGFVTVGWVRRRVR